MAHILVAKDHLVVRLTWWEKLVARRGDQRVPLAAVRRVTVEPDWWRVLHGTHRRGLCVPGALDIGVRRHQAGTDFTAVRPPRPVVCVELAPSAPFGLLAVSARDDAAAGAAVELLLRAAPGIDVSTPWRQPLPVADEAEWADAELYPTPTKASRWARGLTWRKGPLPP